MTEHILESSATLKKSGTKWKAVLITPGKGSSGTYSEEVLKSTGPSAFPAGTHSYIDHSADGTRNPRDLFGVLSEDAYYEDGIGLVGTLEVMPHYAEFANAVAPHTGLSIYASADKSKNSDGEWTVESLIPDRMNSVDLVSYAGRGGELAERLLESARSSFTEPEKKAKKKKTSSASEDSGAAPADDRTNTGKEKVSMEIEELATRVDTLAESLTALTALVTPLAETLTAKVQEEEVEPELDFALIAEAAIAAGLPEAARKVVYDQVRHGAVVETAIADQKSYVESVQNSVRESLGATVRVGSNDINQDFQVSRWGA